jgi:hypothetical protein
MHGFSSAIEYSGTYYGNWVSEATHEVNTDTISMKIHRNVTCLPQFTSRLILTEIKKTKHS